MNFHIVTWEPPIPFSEIAVPNFPADCLPPVIRDYALSVAEYLQVPIDMPSVASLAVLSICVQKKFIVDGGWKEPLSLYTLIVADSAERKSTMIRHMTECIHDYEEKTNNPNRERIARYETRRNIFQKIIKNLEDKAAKDYTLKIERAIIEKRRELVELEAVKEIRLLTNDCTMEKLTSLLAENNERMGIISAEGGILDIMKGRYGGSINIDVFLDAHSGDYMQIDRMGRASERIANPALSILLAVQPNILNGMLGNIVFRERGLTARFLYSYPRTNMGSRKMEPAPVDTGLRSNYVEKINKLLAIPQPEQEAVIRLSTEAHRESIKFGAELEPRLCGDLTLIRNWAGKLHGAILRIAGILHCVQYEEASHKHPIAKETMCNAILIGKYFEEHAKVAHMLMGTDKATEDAKYILHVIKQHGITELTRSELTRLCRARLKASEMNPAIELLIEHKYLRVKINDSQGVGPKVSKYYVNPLWLE